MSALPTRTANTRAIRHTLRARLLPSPTIRLTPSVRHISNQSDQANASSNAGASAQTHFGFRTIDAEEKEDLGAFCHHCEIERRSQTVYSYHRVVKGVFSSVAPKYDLMNDAMSLGVHRLWKDDFVTLLNPGRKGPVKILDMAGGTGDIALRMLDHAREKYADRTTSVVVSDINPDMLKEGRRRVRKTMYHASEPTPSRPAEREARLTIDAQHPRYRSRRPTHKDCRRRSFQIILLTFTRSHSASVIAPPFRTC